MTFCFISFTLSLLKSYQKDGLRFFFAIERQKMDNICRSLYC